MSPYFPKSALTEGKFAAENACFFNCFLFCSEKNILNTVREEKLHPEQLTVGQFFYSRKPDEHDDDDDDNDED